MSRPKRWTIGLPLLMLTCILTIALVRTAPGLAGTTVATDVLSSGGGEGTSTSFRISDTFGQGPIGPVATGASIELRDGFWATISARGAVADTMPPDRVSGFTARAIDDGVVIKWTNPADADFAGTMVRFSIHEYPGDPTEYDPVPNGQGGLFYAAPATVDSFVHTGLEGDREYYYSAFAFDGVPNYAEGRYASATPVDTIPPTAVASFTATAADTTVILRWTNPDDADFKHALVRFSTAFPPTGPTIGSPVPNGHGGMFANAPASADSFVHTHLTNEVTYYYSIWCGDEVPNYSGYWDDSATPEDTIPPGQADYFTASVSGDRAIILRWKNPPDADLEEMHVRYSTSTFPTTPAEGLAIENGSGGSFPAAPAAVDSFLHTGLTAGVVYYYTGFPLDEAGNYLDPAKGDYTTAVDNTPPDLQVSVFQNPYVTNHLDIFLVASEEVEDGSVSVDVSGANVEMEESDALNYVYRGDYELCCTGTLEIEGCAYDLAGNHACTSRDFSSTLVLAKSGGTARSPDGRLEIGFPGRAVPGDAYVLVLESGASGATVYEVSPRGMALEQYVEIAIAYGAADGDPEHLCVALVEGQAVTPMDCYLDRERGCILAYARGLGAFRLLPREDAVTPAYGSGTFRILGNAPNPFVGSTSIELQVVRAGRIQVEIVSVDGRRVRAISEGFAPPGRCSIIWDGCDDYGRRAAAGMYVCRATSGPDQVTHKMVYLR